MNAEELKNTLFVRADGGARIVHYVGCPRIKDWDIGGCSPAGNIKPGKMKFCPVCERMIFASLGAKDFVKKRNAYEALWQKYKVPGRSVRTLFLTAKAKTELKGDILYITSRRDDWYLDLSFRDVRLFHNNYNVAERERGHITTGGFHEHNLISTSPQNRFVEAVNQISKYNFEKAQETHRKKKKPRITFSELDEEYWGFG